MHTAGSLLSLLLLLSPVPAANEYFKIQVVDQDTGRGVPLVELATTNNLRYYTDSNGFVAFHEPGLMDREVFFYVRGHGYQYPKDGFGSQGVRLKTTPGTSATVKIKRLNIAERLYRVTGGGIYADSVLLGEPVPTKQPVLNAQVLGQDSVFSVVYQGKIYWFWGDTNKPSYPLGNFHTPGATSRLPKDGGLDPEKGVDLEYFVGKDGFAKPTAKFPGPGPTWVSGLVVLKEGESGKERMFAHYARIEPPLATYERGLVEFDDAKKEFVQRVKFDMKMPMFPEGHPIKHTENGVEYVYFTHPYPLVRVRATPEDLQDLKKYQAYTCFKPGSRADAPKLDRDADGKLRWGWKTDTAPLTFKLQEELVKNGKMKPEEGLFQLQDADTGKKIHPHGGSVYWNPYRQRWVMIMLEVFGSSLLGEIWYAEADTLVGPWRYARKIVTHDKYSFYNPKHHPLFDKKGGQHIFFEGTYTTLFSGNPTPTPRYEYNQIMYKLDLADERLILPVAIYRQTDQKGNISFATRQKLKGEPKSEEIAFFALDRPAPGSVPVLAKKVEKGLVLEVAKAGDKKAANHIFYALPPAAENLPKTAAPLYEWVHANGQRRYGIDPEQSVPGFERQQQPVCYVWRMKG